MGLGLTIAVAQERETSRVWTRKSRLRPVLLWPGQLRVRSSLQPPWHLSRSLPDLRVCLKKAEWTSASEETLPPQPLKTTQRRGVLLSSLVWATARGRELPFWSIWVEQRVQLMLCTSCSGAVVMGRDACVCAHKYAPKLLQKCRTDFAFYCKIRPDADNLYAKSQPGVTFNGRIYKQLNTRVSTGKTDTTQTLAALVSSGLIMTALYKSQLSACHHSRPQWESRTGQCLGMIRRRVTAHTWAPVVSMAVIINVRKPEWWKMAQVSVEFIAFSADIPQPCPAVKHLEVEYQNILLQFIFLVTYGTNDRQQ